VLLENGHPVYEYGMGWFFQMSHSIVELQRLRREAMRKK